MIKNKLMVFGMILSVLATALALAACSPLKSLDVIGRQSVTSFDEVLKTVPDNVTFDGLNGGWVIIAPDGSARFIWGADRSKAPFGAMLEFEAKPFLAAGLDPDKLPDDYAFYEGGGPEGSFNQMLMVGAPLGDREPALNGEPTALQAYEQIVDNYRDAIHYHASLDHFGVKLNNGNLFEWAKDMATNGYDESNQDKDIVFVLDPKPLIAAGVDPESVEGWAYAKVLVEEEGKMLEVWKLLKAFDLK